MVRMMAREGRMVLLGGGLLSFRLLVFLLLLLVGCALLIHNLLSTLGHSAQGTGAARAGSPSSSGLSPAASGIVGDSGRVVVSSAEEEAEMARRVLGLASELDSLSGPELRSRIEELLRIKQSVLQELRGLEARRKDMQQQVSGFHREIEELKSEATRRQAELERLRVSAEQARLAQEEYARRNTPEIRAPLALRAEMAPGPLSPPKQSSSCTMDDCFDFSRCSLTSGFPVYLYDRAEKGSLFGGEVGFASRPEEACLYVVVEDQGSSPEALENRLQSLPYSGGDGRNHLVILTSGARMGKQIGTRAMVAQPTWPKGILRPDFDLTLPTLKVPETDSREPWQDAESFLPVRRRYLVSFQGAKEGPRESLSPPEEAAVASLRAVKTDVTDDDAFVDVNCRPAVDGSPDPLLPGDWLLCGAEEDRARVLSSSVFALIPAPPGGSSSAFQLRLHESLRHGAIPVVLGGNPSALLPFSEFVDWRLSSVSLPWARATELHFLLRSFSDADLFEMRRQGGMVWRTYLSSAPSALSTLLQVVRERLLIPPPPLPEAASPDAFNGTRPVFTDQLSLDQEPSEPLGPLEPPRPSPEHRRNFSSLLLDGAQRWNSRFDPHFSTAHTPWDPILPTDAKFLGSAGGFRPVGDGLGGTGREFSRAIGGNSPSEQFTVVMLTYEREQVLMESLARLRGLPFLNKVVVVWNSEAPPSPDLQWPELGAPLAVVRPGRNSLNNRFLPFSEVETEAVLSVDDDVHLRHDEIVFAFRVWRENRDRLVGFPGRYHAWDAADSSWNYNSNYSCELSMVLTGAAFYHSYYSHVYSSVMPSSIRDLVDEFVNCEDLAMNFLISHLTRKPPVKVTSRWTFRCPGCPSTLYEDEAHFQERHKCIRFFSRVFGYTPLMYTQYRADSVLFKTRIPSDKQKCFKFI